MNDVETIVKMAKASHVTDALEYGECIPEEHLEAFAHLVIDWVAQQHFVECREERPIQVWIRMQKNKISNRPVESAEQAIEAIRAGGAQ